MPTLLSLMFVLFGGLGLWWLPHYKRKVDCGKAQLDPSMPSFKVMRRVAVGLVIFGLITLAASRFVHLEF